MKGGGRINSLGGWDVCCRPILRKFHLSYGESILSKVIIGSIIDHYWFSWFLQFVGPWRRVMTLPTTTKSPITRTSTGFCCPQKTVSCKYCKLEELVWSMRLSSNWIIRQRNLQYSIKYHLLSCSRYFWNIFLYGSRTRKQHILYPTIIALSR